MSSGLSVAFKRRKYIYIYNFIGAETRELVLTVLTQNRKICNGRTNDFSESCLWIFSLLWKRHGKKTIHTSFIH